MTLGQPALPDGESAAAAVAHYLRPRQGTGLLKGTVTIDEKAYDQLCANGAEGVRLKVENARLREALERVLGALSVWCPVQPVPDPTDCTSGYPEWVRRAWAYAVEVLNG